MSNQQTNLPPTDTGFIGALLTIGILGSALGGGLMTADTRATSSSAPSSFGVCGLMLSIGTIAAGVAIGIGVLPGKSSSTTPKVSARAPKISDAT